MGVSSNLNALSAVDHLGEGTVPKSLENIGLFFIVMMEKVLLRPSQVFVAKLTIMSLYHFQDLLKELFSLPVNIIW